MKKHYAIDLDGTLAFYDGWKGDDHIGDPIPKMVEFIHEIISNGYEWSIFTARVSEENHHDSKYTIMNWCQKHNLLSYSEITAIKRKWFTHFIDDRAMQVSKNEGVFFEDISGMTENAMQIAFTASLPCFNYQHAGSHYKNLVVQPAVYCELNKLSGSESNVVKYVTRHAAKDGIKDLRKAKQNLDFIAQIKYGEKL